MSNMTKKQMIQSADAPQTLGLYSQAVKMQNFVFVSGQLGIEPMIGKIQETTIEGQTKRALQNIEAILKAAKLSLENVLRCEIFMQDLNDFQKMNAIYTEFFSSISVKPARQTVQVARLPMDGLIEISCIAMAEE